MLTVYLAGPITGKSYGQATGWRNYVTQRLENEGKDHIRCLDPMRIKDHLADLNVIDGPIDHPIFDRSAVVGRDLWDVQRSKVVLFNLLGATEVSIGTMVELGAASVSGALKIVVMEKPTVGYTPGNPHFHDFVKELADFWVEDLETAIEIVEAL